MSTHSIPENRSATAPYNFIPLPNEVKEVKSPLLDHNAYNPERLSGHIDLQLTTKSLLFIRGMLSKDEYIASLQVNRHDEAYRYDQDPKNKPKFFHTTKDERPVIPASSLRGMVRNIVEIITDSKMDRVYEHGLFFRTVDNSSLGKEVYRPRMVIEHQEKSTGKNKLIDLVKSGFLIKQGGDYYVKPCESLKIPRDLLNSNMVGTGLYEGKPPNQTPKWEGKWYQYQKVWIKRGNKDEGTSFYKVVSIDVEPSSNLLEGRLVLTGQVPQKIHERVFLQPEEDEDKWKKIDANTIDLFNGDQMTPYQEKAFPCDKPVKDSRKGSGHLQTNPSDWGEPVFYLVEKDQNGEDEIFLGRARMFRLPYHKSPKDLIPEGLKSDTVTDLADVLFGYIGERDLDQSQERPFTGRASRVIFTDAVLPPEVSRADALIEEPITPHILASPKPTAFQQYLDQESFEKENLTHYASSNAKLRGHKRYWHQGKVSQKDITANESDIHNAPRQYTRIWPVKEGITFLSKVFFDNLTPIELGALIWALQPHGDRKTLYCHKLGMGKPLGLGAVNLQATLHIKDQKQRYTSLFNDSGLWNSGYEDVSYPLYNPDERLNWIGKFQTYMAKDQSFANTDRIKSLLKMMQFPGITDKQQVKYLTIKTSSDGKIGFKDRPVLPLSISSDLQPADSVLPPDTLPYAPKQDSTVKSSVQKACDSPQETTLSCKILDLKYGKLEVTQHGPFKNKSLTCKTLKNSSKYKKGNTVKVLVTTEGNKINNPNDCKLVS